MKLAWGRLIDGHHPLTVIDEPDGMVRLVGGDHQTADSRTESMFSIASSSDQAVNFQPAGGAQPMVVPNFFFGGKQSQQVARGIGARG